MAKMPFLPQLRNTGILFSILPLNLAANSHFTDAFILQANHIEDNYQLSLPFLFLRLDLLKCEEGEVVAGIVADLELVDQRGVGIRMVEVGEILDVG